MDLLDSTSPLMDVQLPVAVRFGETEMLIEDIVKLGVGSVIELSTSIDEPVELVVNGKTYAKGEVVSVDGYYGIRILEVIGVANAEPAEAADES